MPIAPDALLQEGRSASPARRPGASGATAIVQVLASDPANADALYYLAMAACQQGRFDEGMDLAQRAVAARPQHARAHNLIGMTFGRLGRNDDALAAVRCGDRA